MSFDAIRQAVLGPLVGHINFVRQCEDHAQLVSTLSPAVLQDIIHQGLNGGQQSINTEFRETRFALQSWSELSLSNLAVVGEAWADANAKLNGMAGDSFKARADSAETHVAATVGMMLDPTGGLIGETVGALLGGMYASQKVAKKVNESIANLRAHVDGWAQACEAHFEQLLPAAYNADLQAIAARKSARRPKAPPRFRKERRAATVVALITLGIFVVYKLVIETSAQDEIVEVVEPVELPPPPMAHIDGAWQSTAGADYRIEVRDGEYVLLNQDVAQSWNPMEFFLTAVDEYTFTVRHNATAEHVRKLAFHDSAEESCSRIFSHMDGQPLRARLSGDTLTLDAVTMEITNQHVRRRGGRIAECTRLGDAVFFMRQVVLKKVE